MCRKSLKSLSRTTETNYMSGLASLFPRVAVGVLAFKKRVTARFGYDGLLKFMEDNPIGNEFFLMFKYRGGSKFSVIIFDLTATEIQYNCNNASTTSDVNQIQNSDILEGIGDSQKAKSGDDSIEFIGSSACHLFSPISAVGYKRSKERTEEAENKSLPNFFEVTLTPSYINMNRGYLNVPSNLAQLLAPPDSARLIKIEDANNNEWVVRLTRKQGNHRLTQGWLRFVRGEEVNGGRCLQIRACQGR
ncbi:hypothetical protein LIER_12899 [Lithospermum erythrorhizon]|uniref:TF-B3 domain-containing protein n=1 Tax=Lithospermum erythrorhizon TaxID=34254 RepID=A0AAV3PTP1_LITER